MNPDRQYLTRRRLLGLGVGAFAATVAACSDDPDASPTSEASPTSTTSAPPTLQPTQPPLATATLGPSTDLDEMIGQMLMFGFRGLQVDASDPLTAQLQQGLLGNVVLFDLDGPSGGQIPRNVESPAQLQALTAQLQSLAPETVLVAADQEGGYVARLSPKYGFPPTLTALEMAQRNDLAFTRAESARMAEVLRAAGVNLNLAPVLDVDLNPDNPVIGGFERSFSADPDMVTEQALAFIQGHHDVGVLTTLKHFPGHGSSKDDSHEGFVDVTGLWTRQELDPFRNVIQAGMADAVMTAHIFNSAWDPDLPATLSKAVITGILREELGFDGVVITDDMQMGAIRQYYGFEAAIEMAINAGADMVAVSNNLSYDTGLPVQAFNAIQSAVIAGRIPEVRIIESYNRIMALKSRLS